MGYNNRRIKICTVGVLLKIKIHGWDIPQNKNPRNGITLEIGVLQEGDTSEQESMDKKNP
jgi:hypothetical protein